MSMRRGTHLLGNTEIPGSSFPLFEHRKVSPSVHPNRRWNSSTRPTKACAFPIDDSRSLHNCTYKQLPFHAFPRRPGSAYRSRSSRSVQSMLLCFALSYALKPKRRTQGGRRTHCYEWPRQSKSRVGVQMKLVFHVEDRVDK